MSTLTTAATIDTADVKNRVRRFAEAQEAIKREVHKVIVGQNEVVEHVLISLFVGGHCFADRVAGHGEDATGANNGPDARAEVQPDSVYAGFDALGHYGYGHY